MTSLKYAVKQFVSSPISNILIVFQFAVMMISAVLLTAVIENRIKEYSSLKGIMDSQGAMVCLDGYMDFDPEKPLTDKSQIEELIPDSKAVCAYKSIFIVKGNDTPINVICYDKAVLNMYRPDISEGKWLSDTDDSEIEIAVRKGYAEVGDILTFTAYDKNGNEKEVKARVAATADEGTYFFGSSDFDAGFENCQSVYSPLLPDTDTGVYPIFTSFEALERNGISCWPWGKAFVTYENADDEQNIKNMKALTSLGTVMSLTQFTSNSKEHIRDRLALLIPVFICVTLLILVSITTMTSSGIKAHMRMLGIYYSYGADVGSVTAIIVSLQLICIVFGSLVSLIIFNTLKILAGSDLIVSFDIYSFAAVSFICIISLIITLVIAKAMINRGALLSACRAKE